VHDANATNAAAGLQQSLLVVLRSTGTASDSAAAASVQHLSETVAAAGDKTRSDSLSCVNTNHTASVFSCTRTQQVLLDTDNYMRQLRKATDAAMSIKLALCCTRQKPSICMHMCETQTLLDTVNTSQQISVVMSQQPLRQIAMQLC
jgi:hypothetical protein